MNKTEIEVGQVFYASWGYDQTNIDFVKVIGLTATKKTAICRMVGKKRVDQWTVAPTEPFGLVFRLQVRQGRDELYLVGSYPFVQGRGILNNADANGYGYDTRLGSFWLYTKPVYETPVGMGH